MALEQGIDDFFHLCDPAVAVKRDERLADVVVVEQDDGMAGVLAGDAIDGFQNALGAEGQILQIADRGRHNV